MTTIVLLQQLRGLGVRLAPYPDRTIHYKAPHGVMTDALQGAMRTHKQALLDLVETYEERSGILEYDGGLSSAEAEAVAWACVLREPSP